MTSEEYRDVEVEFMYQFDMEDIQRIKRARGLPAHQNLTDEEVSEYVSDILTLELTSPDPLASEEEE